MIKKEISPLEGFFFLGMIGRHHNVRPSEKAKEEIGFSDYEKFEYRSTKQWLLPNHPTKES